jgi:hypothetical protein
MKTSQRPLESPRPNKVLLLQRRMTALGLNMDEWTNFEPAMLDELESLCLECESRQLCAHDLAIHSDDPTWHDWRDYCPNVAQLNVLSALQSYLRSNLSLEQAVERVAEDPRAMPIETD